MNASRGRVGRRTAAQMNKTWTSGKKSFESGSTEKKKLIKLLWQFLIWREAESNFHVYFLLLLARIARFSCARLCCRFSAPISPRQINYQFSERRRAEQKSERFSVERQVVDVQCVFLSTRLGHRNDKTFPRTSRQVRRAVMGIRQAPMRLRVPQQFPHI